jgi:hypothetical protein
VALGWLLFEPLAAGAVLGLAILLLGAGSAALRTTRAAVVPLAQTTFILLLLATLDPTLLGAQGMWRLVDNTIGVAIALALACTWLGPRLVPTGAAPVPAAVR